MGLFHALDRAHAKSLYPKSNLGHAIGAEAAYTGVGMGASYLFGELHGRYHEEAEVKIPFTDKKAPANLLVGVLAKGASFYLGMKGHSVEQRVTNEVSNAGLYSFAFAKGVAAGTEASGRTTLLLDKGSTPSSASLPRASVVGEIPPAPRGSFLSHDEMAHFATRTR